nr:insulinase family protein [Lachnospiraceae bacterium]
PLKKALYDAGIGEDISGGYDSGVMQPYFSITVKGTDLDKRDEFTEIVNEVFKEQARNGVDEKTLLAAINGTEFKFREADFGSFPKGLIYGLNMLDSWLYDEKQPFLYLQPLEVLSDLKSKIGTGYFEDLIERFFISNTHSSLVTVVPEEGLSKTDDEKLRKKLSEYKASLSKDEIESLISDTKKLKEYQDEPSSEEELRSIPLLKREDLTKEARPIHFTPYEVDGVNVVHHNIETNGINYVEAVFDMTDLSCEEAGIFSLALRLLGLVDTENYTYTDFSNEINLYTGGMIADLSVVTKPDGKYMLYVSASTKYTYENATKALTLFKEFLLFPRLDNKKRIKEIVFEEKSHLNHRIMTAGNTIALTRASASFAPASVIKDAISGYGYYEMLCDICENFDERIDDFIQKSKSLMKKAFVVERLTVSTAGNERALELVKEKLPLIKDVLYKGGSEAVPVYAKPIPVNQGLYSASKVNYVCRAGSFAKGGYEYKGVFNILRVILSYDYLWNNVRVKGGAYGCHSHFNRSGLVAFTSYRDPKLSETKEVFEKVADYLENFNAGDRDMTKYVIGTISSLDTPLTPQMDATRSFHSYLTGVGYETIQREREEVINADVEDVRALAPLIRSAMEQGYFTVVGGQEAIEKEKDLFDEILQIR